MCWVRVAVDWSWFAKVGVGKGCGGLGLWLVRVEWVRGVVG